MKMSLEARETQPHYSHTLQHLHNLQHLHDPQHQIQRKTLVDASILIPKGHQMQDNQTINGVQLGATIGHTLILLRMVEHTKHAIIAELPKGVTVLINVQLMLLLKCYNSLSNRGAQIT